MQPLPAERLRTRSNPDELGFDTTADLTPVPPSDEPTWQARAIESIEFALGMPGDGYNVFVMGPTGIGKRALITKLVTERARDLPTPSDWCYVHNFVSPDHPRTLELPAGRGIQLRGDVDEFLEEVGGALRDAFDSDEYQERVREISEKFKAEHESAIEALAKDATAENIRMIRTPNGFGFAPVAEGEVLGPEEFAQLSEDEQSAIKAKIEALQEKMAEIMRNMARAGESSRKEFRAFNRRIASNVLGHLTGDLKPRYEDLPQAVRHIEAIEGDMIEHVDQLHQQQQQGQPNLAGLPQTDKSPLEKYRINVVVDNSDHAGAPFVKEDHPTHKNLVGRVEHKAQLGALLTDFSLIKAGALQRANHGFLLLDARMLLTQPLAWETLKRALNSNQIKIESIGEALSMVSTVSLDPEPIPLNVKVLLVGTRRLYYMLHQADPEFSELFKVVADFEERVDRSEDAQDSVAQLIAGIAAENQLKSLDRHAVARVIEHSSRFVGDAERLSTNVSEISDLVREADYFATQNRRDIIGAVDIDEAVEARRRRIGRVQERIREQIQRHTVLIDTEDSKVGQINGLSVLSMGNHSFGQPNRITATARLGRGQVVDIEREARLGGSLHSKGVLILSNFLASRFAKNKPLSLNASLVFEQSYGRVDGDSASVAETVALFSALSEIPIKQSLAVTGSLNQRGEVQAIGGVNEKIEGFFDVCAERGLTGEQGVLIPASNVKHLMLRHDIVEAAEAGKFFVYAIETIDQAIELLTGVSAGKPDEDGKYPDDSVNALVSKRLDELTELSRNQGKNKKGESEDETTDEAAAGNSDDDENGESEDSES